MINLFFQSGNLNPWEDDCALLEKDILITTDSMSENTHFRLDWSSPEDLALKLFHSNLSDLASSGGSPEWILLNTGFPQNTDESFIKKFSKTLLDESSKYSCRIMGGDTFRSESLQLTLTMIGKIKKRYLKRTGGSQGDTLYITGHPGLSRLGYKILSGTVNLTDTADQTDSIHFPATKDQDDAIQQTGKMDLPGDANLPESLKQEALKRHLRPEARYKWAKMISEEEKVHAAMDVSDGIFEDSLKLALANHLDFHIDLNSIPVFPNLDQYLSLEEIICGGEDYEILFLGESGLSFPFPVSAIGKASPGNGRVLYERDGAETKIQNLSYLHFYEP